jgi:hypothetical protein
MMYKVKGIVKTSGAGRTATWGAQYGTVVKVLENTALIQWHDSAVEDEMEFNELISTGEFAPQIPSNYRKLCLTGDEITAETLVSIND